MKRDEGRHPCLVPDLSWKASCLFQLSMILTVWSFIAILFQVEKVLLYFSIYFSISNFIMNGCSVQFSSVAQSCPTLCDPMNCSIPGLPVHHQLPEFTKLTSIESVMPSSHLILCCPLLLLPPIPPSIRVFSKESTLRMRWPNYWSFSFSISPSKEHPGLISFRMNRAILSNVF